MNNFQMAGLPAMMVNIRKRGKQMVDEIEKGLYQETQVEATEVKRRTPVWNPARALPHGHTPGSLRASVHVVGPIRTGNTIYTLIAAGGPSAPYAVYVHEDLDALHASGQAKFIESVILESRAYMAQRVLKRVRLNNVP